MHNVKLQKYLFTVRTKPVIIRGLYNFCTCIVKPDTTLVPLDHVQATSFVTHGYPEQFYKRFQAKRRNKKSLKIGDGPDERDRSRRAAAERLRFETKKRESEGREVVLGTLLKLLVKDKLLHSRKVSMNTELSPLRREKRGTEVQRYGTLNEAMKQ